MARVDPVKFRSAMCENVKQYQGQDVAVFLSGGMDSMACLFPLLDVGANVTAYTIHLEGIISDDFKRAAHVAKHFGIPHVAVPLHKDLDRMAAEIRWLTRYRKMKTKTQIEVCWPLFHAVAQTKEPVIVTGLAAGLFFCTSKKYALHYKDQEDRYRNHCLADPNHGKRRDFIRYCETKQKFADFPWLHNNIFELFMGSKFDEVNKPRQKEPIHAAIPELHGVLKVKPNVNLQLGNSGIAENFERLLKSRHNTKRSKAVIGIYNSLRQTSGPTVAI